MATVIGALQQAMASAPTVGGTLANHPGTSAPIVVFGTIPEGSTGLPAISFRQSGLGNNGPGAAVKTRIFIVNCWGATHLESYNLADAVTELFRDADNTIDGFSFESHAFPSGASVPDPKGDAYNTPVQVRVSFLGG